MKDAKWILCPVCGNKTCDKIRKDTVLKNFPLFCPKCKHETLVNVKQLNLTIIQKQPLSRRADKADKLIRLKTS